MIKLENISSGYGVREVLSGLSAEFEGGRLTAIVGPNGCGKSTLLKTVNGIIPATSGQVTVDGIPTTAMTRRQIAHKIAYLAQGNDTPDMTVEQLVLQGRFPHLHYPRRYGESDYAAVRSALERTDMTKYAAAHLDTLSGGLRQTAYIAMALAQDTPFILLDEPTTYLDVSHQLGLMRTLMGLTGTGKGVVAVLHDLPLAFTFAHSIVVMDGGRIVCAGGPQDVCHSGAIERVFGVVLRQDGDYHYSYNK